MIRKERKRERERERELITRAQVGLFLGGGFLGENFGNRN